MDRPTVSVVTPSYDQAEFLRENIRSVRDQGYPAVEHVVVDGGSTDGTLEILREHGVRVDDPGEVPTDDDRRRGADGSDWDGYRLRWVSESDRGQTHALNKGIAMARGEWVGWLNVDDYYLPGAFDALARAVGRTPDAEMVYGDLLFVDRDGEELYRRYHTRPSAFVQRHWTLFAANHCSFFRRDLFDRLGGFDESKTYTMDVEFLWRVLRADVDCVHVPELLGARRFHDEAKTAVDRERVVDEMDEFQNVERRRLPRLVLGACAAALKSTYILAEGFDPRTPASPFWSAAALGHELSRPVVRRLRRGAAGSA